jgi:hypothetical protein
MNSRERWQAVLSGKQPDRVPCDYSGTAEVTACLLAELDCATERQLWERLGVDKSIPLAPKHPLAKEENWHIQSLWSIWHIEIAKVNYGDNLGVYKETVSHPLAGAAADFWTRRPLGHQQHPMEPMIVARFFRAANLILQSQNHSLGISDLQWSHAYTQPRTPRMRSHL